MSRLEQIAEANKDLETMSIKGKDYVQVNSRIAGFKRAEPDGRIVTKLISDDGNRCVFKAEIYWSGESEPAATGHAYEERGTNPVNKTSYLENCETSAIGRALGILGIGLDVSVASAEEVKNAQAQQEKQPPKFDRDAAIADIRSAKKFCVENGVSEQGITDWLNASGLGNTPREMSDEQLQKFADYLADLADGVKVRLAQESEGDDWKLL